MIVFEVLLSEYQMHAAVLHPKTLIHPNAQTLNSEDV
jgi:hypothetical protein